MPTFDPVSTSASSRSFDLSRNLMDQPKKPPPLHRRKLLKLAALATSALAFSDSSRSGEAGVEPTTSQMLPVDPPSGSHETVTTERRGHVLLIGLSRAEAETG
jgi:hypothetical protein